MDIIGFPNYLIYEDGRVWSKERKQANGYLHKGKFIKSNLDKGYLKISLINSKRKTFLVHRLIAINYIPNPEKKPTVDHINRNTLDNRIENLRWATMKEQRNNQGVIKIDKRNKSGHTNIKYLGKVNKWEFYRRNGPRKRFESKIDCICFKFIILLKIKAKII
jgi:hypothetical protein